MTLLLTLLCIVCVLTIGGVAFLSKAREGSSSAAPRQTQAELQAIAHNLELPKASIVAGISDSRDLDFITARAPHLRRMLIRERSQLVRGWLRENRVYLNQLLRLHRLIERTSENLSVAVELRIAATYLLLQVLLLAADAVVAVAGPFRARAIGFSTLEAFNQLSATIAATVAPLDATKKAAIRASWARVS